LEGNKMENIAKRLIVPIFAGLTFMGCDKTALQEPKKEDFTKSNHECTEIAELRKICLHDVDEDRKVDLVTIGNSNRLKYYAEGYKIQIYDTNYEHAKVMSSKLRDSLSKVFQGIQESRFEKKMMEYEENRK